MKYYCIAAIIISQFVSIPLLFSAEYKFIENVKREIAENKWEKINDDKQPNKTISEWTPHGQALGSFSEVVSIIFHDFSCYPCGPKSAYEILEARRLQELKSYSGADMPIKWNILRLSRNDVLYEWSLSNMGVDNIQICRVILHGKKAHQVMYSKIGEIDSKSRQEWIERLGGER